MDLWKYYSIGHKHHNVCNPLSEAKLDEIVDLLACSKHSRVLDIACGKGEFLVRTAARWRCTAVGVDAMIPSFGSAAASATTALRIVVYPAEKTVELVEPVNLRISAPRFFQAAIDTHHGPSDYDEFTK